MTTIYLEVKHTTAPNYEYAPKYTGELPPTIEYLGDKYTVEFSWEHYTPDKFEGLDRITLIETLGELGWELLSVVEYGVKPSIIVDPSAFTVLMYFKCEVK